MPTTTQPAQNWSMRAGGSIIFKETLKAADGSITSPGAYTVRVADPQPDPKLLSLINSLEGFPAYQSLGVAGATAVIIEAVNNSDPNNIIQETENVTVTPPDLASMVVTAVIS